MDFITQFSRQYRRPIERSISEHKGDHHRFPEDFYKGHQNLRIENTNSYHQGTYVFSALIIALSLISLVSYTFRVPHSSSDSSHFEMSCAKDLRINKSLSHESSPKIKEEMLPPPPRRFVSITPLNSL